MLVMAYDRQKAAKREIRLDTLDAAMVGVQDRGIPSGKKWALVYFEMMKAVVIQEAKTQFSRLLRRVAAGKKSLLRIGEFP
jgi:hypothetical protein